MGGKQRLTRRTALALMGSGATLATGQTFGLADSTMDRSSSVSVAAGVSTGTGAVATLAAVEVSQV